MKGPKFHDPTQFVQAREQRIGIITVLVAGLLAGQQRHVTANDSDRKLAVATAAKWADDILAIA